MEKGVKDLLRKMLKNCNNLSNTLGNNKVRKLETRRIFVNNFSIFFAAEKSNKGKFSCSSLALSKNQPNKLILCFRTVYG